MGQEQCLEFGGRDLHALVLDQFFETIDDEHVPVAVHVSEVSRVQPAVVVYGGAGCVRAIEIAAHHLRSPYPDLAILTRRHILAGGRIDDSAFRVRYGLADRAVLMASNGIRGDVCRWARLRQSIALLHHALDSGCALLGSTRAEGRGAREELAN